MRQVIKGTEPASFTDWKACANEDWQPTYETLQNPQKRDLHLRLLLEQRYACCYCGREIELESSHIEHFRPQEHFEHLALDYENLHASCLRETKPGNPLHCGHRKDNWFEEELHISPLEENCEQRFCYLLTGEIQASANDACATKMIDVLALDIAYLNNRREEQLLGFFDNDFLINATEEDLHRTVAFFRSVENDRQVSFGHVIARYAEQLIRA
ncbi:TIGR02646 family protein [Pseudomonas gingeri]|uniref:retron system putative HNH endonuclease n=1 Tax=Pseudomonas gingeri TaxID=117681 RepID=UPI0015B9F1A7|nr:retron system putative HNH endonuclease [Pseudomonas gingeri]NWE72671.1 TIGR02646 family protein [Pseudomonas gingeri]